MNQVEQAAALLEQVLVSHVETTLKKEWGEGWTLALNGPQADGAAWDLPALAETIRGNPGLFDKDLQKDVKALLPLWSKQPTLSGRQASEFVEHIRGLIQQLSPGTEAEIPTPLVEAAIVEEQPEPAGEELGIEEEIDLVEVPPIASAPTAREERPPIPPSGPVSQDPRLLQGLALLSQALERFVQAKRGAGSAAPETSSPSALVLLSLIMDHWWEFQDVFPSERGALVSLQATLRSSQPVAGDQVEQLLEQMEQVLNRIAPREAEQVAQLRVSAEAPSASATNSSRHATRPPSELAPPLASARERQAPRVTSPPPDEPAAQVRTQRPAGRAKWGIALLVPLIAVGAMVTYGYQAGQKNKAEAVCRLRLQALSQAFFDYTLDHGRFPAQEGWTDAIAPYVEKLAAQSGHKELERPGVSGGPFNCPLAGRYLYNGAVAGKSEEELVDGLKETAILRDAVACHEKGAGVAFADGRTRYVKDVASMRWGLGQASKEGDAIGSSSTTTGDSKSAAPREATLFGFFPRGNKPSKRLVIFGAFDPTLGWISPFGRVQARPGAEERDCTEAEAKSLGFEVTSANETELKRTDWRWVQGPDPVPFTLDSHLTTTADGHLSTASLLTHVPDDVLGLAVSGPFPGRYTHTSVAIEQPAAEVYRPTVKQLVGSQPNSHPADLRVDLDHDGTEENVYIASSHPLFQRERAEKDETSYIAAFFLFQADGKVHAEKLFELTLPLAKGEMWPGALPWPYDLDGDGKMELVVSLSRGEDNEQIFVYSFDGRHVFPLLGTMLPYREGTA